MATAPSPIRDAESGAVMQRIVDGRITFTPREDGKGYDFVASTRFDKLFSGIVAPKPTWIPPADGSVAHIGAADTFDEDYGRLLGRTLNGWRARQGSNLRPRA
jgi:hypothetical protein